MDISDDEKAKLEAEWKKMSGFGRAVQRQRIIATVASIGAALPFFIAGIVVVLGGLDVDAEVAMAIGLSIMGVGVTLGAIIRAKLWPKGQFT
ncbi:MAG: hypothetical protein HOW73_51175 [Polyangiaceae bacterium]|nr:hypothetical protein [Polyangiaceae bacterium]